MQVEFEAAVDDGNPFMFAIGCLIAAWRDMMKQSEGRLAVANYALAIGLLVPMAALQFKQAVDFSTFPREGLSYGMQAAGAVRNPYLMFSQNSATPVLLSLWMLLGLAHLRLAWVLVEGDWPRVVKYSALIGAATIALSLFTGVLMLDLLPMGVLIAAFGIELMTIGASAWWHARLASRAVPDLRTA